MVRFAIVALVCTGWLGCTGEITGAPPVGALECGAQPRLARLSGVQYREVVKRLVPTWTGVTTLDVPFSQPRRTDLFSTWASQASVSEYEVDDVWAAADQVATEWIKAQKVLCTGVGRTAECVASVYGPLLSTAWSRKPSADELASLTAELADAERTLPGPLAATAVVRAVLMGPDLLFRSEVGQAGALESHEVAAALAFTLTNAPPDATLRQLAEAGALTTPEAIGEQAKRLLDRPAEVAALRQFVRELFQYENATQVFKDRAVYPFHRPNELTDDTEQVVAKLIETHARSGLQRALLTSDLVHVRPTTAKSWGLTPSADAGVFMSDPSRTGLLTHPSWLVAMSEPDHNHLVRRGRFVRERLLCGEVPNLPGGVVPQIEKKPGLTFRQRVEQHSKDPACSGCHQLMDPLGTGFEAWDHLGRAQTMDNGGAVTTHGALDGAGDGDGPYADTKELMQRLADSPVVRACWVKQVFQFVRGRPATDADACEIGRLASVYEASGEDTLAVIEALFTSPDFLTRRPELAP